MTEIMVTVVTENAPTVLIILINSYALAGFFLGRWAQIDVLRSAAHARKMPPYEKARDKRAFF
jgi:hypothetical protein